MPRNNNPGSITVGTGLAAQDSIEANALIHPTGGNDGLRVHILDPSRAHMARGIGLEDVGGFYSSDHVEGALQEVGATLTAPSGLQNGVVAGCTFTPAALTITLATPSTVRIGTDRDLSAQVEVLTNNQTNWVYVDPAGTLTHATGASPPSFTSPENVLLWRIITSGGAITSFTDARFWVPNLDRKVPFTVRSSGTALDSVAEACFVTLEAAILYLGFFGNGVQQKTTLIIRGPHTVASTMTLPQNDILFEGDENAEFITGAALTPMFDLNGQSRITFTNIRFTCNHATSVAIQDATGSNSDVRVERCRFVTGTQNWNRAINLAAATPTAGVILRECQISAADVGVRITRPVRAKVLDCVVTEVGAAGTVGISLGATAVALTTEGQSVARGCVVTGFAAGILLNGLNNEASSCVLAGSDTGVYIHSDSQFVRVKDCDITLDTTTGLTGVLVDSAPATRVSGCTLVLVRAAWVAEVPVGVSVSASNDVGVVDCVMTGFFNDVAETGAGVSATGVCDRLTVRGGAISTSAFGVVTTNAGSDGTVVSGVDIRGVVTGVSLAGPGVAVTDCQIVTDATVGLNGVALAGRNARVTGCAITNSRGAGSFGGGDNPTGILVEGDDSIVQGCYVSGFSNSVNPLLGVGIWLTGDRATVTGGTIDLGQFGFVVDGANAKIDSVNVVTTNTCFRLQGDGTAVSNCLAHPDPTTGHTGISVQALGPNTTITGCRVINTRAAWAGETPIGVQFSAANGKMVNTFIGNFRNPGDALGFGLAVTTGGGAFNVTGCTIDTCYNGIVLTAIDTDDWEVTGCRFNNIDIVGISAAGCANIVISNNTFEDPGSTAAIVLGNGTQNAVVSGNHIDGNENTNSGISFSGTDTNTTRTRRFTIADNTIQAVLQAGIILNGYVQNGTVVGNHVDGFLASDANNPRASGIGLLSAATGALVRQITLSNNTVWRCVRGIIAIGTNADPVHQLTFDGNNVHHCGVAQTGATITTFATGGSAGIGVDQGRQIVVSGNTINKIGRLISNTDVEGFPNTAGPDVLSQGIFLNNCLGCDVTGNTVTDSMSTGAGFGNGIYIRQGGAGHGAAATFTNNNVVVSNNNTLWNTGLGGNGEGNHGVLVQVDRGTDPATAAHVMSNVVVNGNVVRLVKTAGIRVGVGTESTMDGLVVSGNSVRESAAGGIRVESNGSTASVLNRAAINGNTVVSVTGVGIAATPGGVGVFTGVSIDGNAIENTDSHGIAIIPGVTGVVVGDLTVSNNKLLNTSVAGNAIALLNSVGATPFEHIAVRGNQISNAQDATTDAIRILSTDVTLRDVVVADNTIANPANVGTPGRGVSIITNVSLSTANGMRRISVTGNTIHCADNHCLAVRADGLVENLVISDNILDTNASPGRPIFIETDRTTSANEAVEGVVVSGNVCKGGIGSRMALTNGNRLRGLTVIGNHFSNAVEGEVEEGDHAGLSVSIKTINTGGSTPGISNLAITGNSFFENEAQGLSLRFGASADEVADGIADVSVIGNTFSRCTVGGTHVGSSVCRYAANGATRNLTIANNTFADCTGEDSITQGTIHVLAVHTTGTDASIENLAITGNSLNNCGGCGIKFEDSLFGTTFTADGLVISGNRIQNQVNDAIRVSFAVATAARMLDISNNVIDTVNGPTASDLGINVIGPAGVALVDVNILNNQIRNAGTTTGGDGQIVVDCGNALLGLNICGNNIAAGDFTAGIFVEASSTLSDVVISNNAINEPSPDGIFIQATGANDISTLTVCGNSIVNAGDDGIQVSWNGGTLSSCTINNNVINNPAAQGIQVGVANSGFVEGLTVNGNTVRSSNSDGIQINLDNAAGSLEAVSVVGNSIWDFGTAAGLNMSSGVAFSVVVASNSFFNNTASGTGMDFNIEGQIRGFNVSDNAVHMGDELTTACLIFDTGAGADQLNMSFTGNSFRGAATAVTVVGSFSPDRSVCANNNERTTGGAGGWAAFAAVFTNSVTTPNQD